MSKIKKKAKEISGVGSSLTIANCRIIIAVFTVLLYSNSIFNDYNMDDELVTRNHKLTSKGISAIPEIFTSPYYSDEQGYAYEYRPVVLSSFAIEHSLFGEHAAMSHFINLLLYVITCVIVFLALLKLLSDFPIIVPLAIALLFSAHTAHTESVCNIKCRDEILALLFSGIALYSIIYFAISEKWIWVLFTLLAYTMAFLSKSTSISLIPIAAAAVVLFTQLKFRNYIIVFSLLLIPTYLFVNIDFGIERLKIVSYIFGITLVLYVLRYFRQIIGSIFLLLQNFKPQTTLKNLVSSEDSGLPSIAQFSLEAILPDKKILKNRIAAPVLIAVLIYVLLLYNRNNYWALLPLGFIVYGWAAGGNAFGWWASTCLAFCLTMNGYLYIGSPILIQEYYNEYYVNFTSMFLLLLVFYGRRDAAIPSAISALAVLALGVIKTEYINYMLPNIVALFLIRFEYARIALFVLLPVIFLLQMLNIGEHNSDVKFFFDSAGFIAGIIALFIFHFRPKLITVLPYVFLTLSIISFAIMLQNLDVTVSRVSLNDIQTFSNQTANQLNPQIIEKTDRPIHYTEGCVDLEKDPLSVRLGTSFEILFHYLKKTVLPYPLAYYYGYKFIAPQKITDAVPLISFIVHILLFLIALFLLHKDPLISFGLFTYLFSIAVFSNYVQYVPGMVADRFLLIPSLGWSIVVVGVLRKFSGIADNAKNVTWASVKPVAKYTFAGLLALYSTLTFARNFDWKDDLTLFRKDIEYVDESSQAHNLLALHLMQHASRETDPMKQQALTNEALTHFKKAEEIYPDFFNVAYDIGRVYSILNKPDSAILAFERALAIDSASLPNIHLTLCDLYFDKKNYEKSADNARKYIAIMPNDYNGYNKLSYNLFVQKRYEESIEVNQQAIRNIPDVTDPYVNISRVFLELGQKDSAITYLEKAIRIEPYNQGITNALNQLKGQN